MDIGLIGASFETSNMGVGALAAGAIRCLYRRWPDARVYILDYALKPSCHALVVDGAKVDIDLVNIRFSKKVYLPNNIALLIALAIMLRILPGQRVRRWILNHNTVLREMNHTEMVVSSAGGDSFSDIYGRRRLLYVALPQVLVLLLRKKLVLLPQTFGPFRSRLSKMVARFIIKRSTLVYTRDRRNLAELNDLLMGTTHPAPRFRYDMGFSLEPQAPAHVTVVNPDVLAGHSAELVGFNISGLLYMGGYTRNNMFGLLSDYQEFARRTIDLLIRDKGASILLVPHVFGGKSNPESDVVACLELHRSLRDRYSGRFGMLDGHYDQSEIKHVIGKCGFFVGSRMHACIAAISQCIPTVPIAYSDKFVRVMETVGCESVVADARNLDVEQLVAHIGRIYDRRAMLRRSLEKSMPDVVAASLGLFDVTAAEMEHDELSLGKVSQALDATTKRQSIAGV